MRRIVQRAAKLMVAAMDPVTGQAEALRATGQNDAALVLLELASAFGHSPSRAHKAWLLIEGRDRVARDGTAAFELAKEGARLGCHHCQGVMALCCAWGCGCQVDAARSLELARESSGKGSRYGQYTLGWLHHGV